MRHIWGAAALIAAMTLGTSAQARDCGDGAISGGLNTNAEAGEIMECRLWGRAFCRAAENRDFNMNQQEAGDEVSKYLKRRMAATGSHLSANWDPLAHQAAAAAFALNDLVPGSLYYYAMYSCGIIKQLGQQPQKRRASIHQAFEQGASQCLQDNPPEGSGFPNPDLKECMRESYNRALD